MKKKKVTRFLAGILTATIVLTSTGMEQLAYAEEQEVLENTETIEPEEIITENSVEENQDNNNIQDSPEDAEVVSDEYNVNLDTNEKIEEISINNAATYNAENTVTDDSNITESAVNDDSNIIENAVNDDSNIIEINNGHVEWKVEDGTLYITGDGDFSEGSILPWNNREDITKAIVNVTNCTNAKNMFSGLKNIESIVFEDFDTSNIVDMSSMFDGCVNLTSLNVSSFNTAKVTSMRRMFANCQNLTSVDLNNFSGNSLQNTSGMFFNCEELKTIKINNLTTDNVEDMSYMFYQNLALKNLDLSNFNTSNVKDMRYMFFACKMLETLNINSFDTSSVTNMYWMFKECTRLSELNVSSFNTSNVTNMQQMFYYCMNLTDLDISNFNTSKVTDMSGMFQECRGLKNIKFGKNFDTSNVKTMANMFSRCRSLENVNLSTFNTSKVTDMSSMFNECKVISELDLSSFDTTNVTSVDSMFAYMKVEALDLSSFNASNITKVNGVFNQCDNLKQIKVPKYVRKDTAWILPGIQKWYLPNGISTKSIPSEQTESITLVYNVKPDIPEGTILAEETYKQIHWKVTNTGILTVSGTGNYLNDENLTPWNDYASVINTAIINIENCTSFKNMFYNCSKLKTLDLSDLDTSKVTDMSGMFNGCFELTNLDLNNFNTANVTDMSDMFYGCAKLNELNFSNFNTSKVTDMSGMFYDCSKLNELNLNYFDTSKTTNMSGMFSGCGNLTNLDLNNFDTSKVTDMSNMFYNCINLANINIHGFNTSNVTNMSSMFSGCRNVSTLDLQNFDTENVIDMFGMFSYCNKVKNLELDNFKTSKVTDMSFMFSNCNSLYTLNLSNFDMSRVYNTNFMFNGCDYLYEIETPKNLKRDSELPTGTWYDFQGNEMTILPKRSEESIIIGKNHIPSNLLAEETIGDESTENYIHWSLDRDGNLIINGKGDWTNSDENNIPWSQWKNKIKTATVALKDTTNMNDMFSGCTKLETVSFDDSSSDKITCVSNMFKDCTSLTTIDLSNFDFSNIATDENISGLFDNCTSLTTIKTPKNLQVNYEFSNSCWGNDEGIMTSLPKNMESLTITKKIDISNAKIVISQKEYIYDRNECKPKVYVKLNDNFLKDNDYTISYENNINAGTANIIVKGKGEYAGTASSTFVIKKADAPNINSYTLKVNGEIENNGEIDLDEVFGPQITGIESYEIINYDSNSINSVDILEHKLIYKTNIVDETTSAKIAIKISSTNYNDVEGTVIIETEVKENNFEVSNNIAKLESGKKYTYIPKVNYSSIAFTSIYDKSDITIRYNDGSGWKDWNYNTTTGIYSMSMVRNKKYLITYEKAENGPNNIEITLPGYRLATKNTSFTVSNLTDADLNGNGSAARVSAAKYAMSGLNITATGTQKYVRNFTNALGNNDNVYADGYFLAFRMKVQTAPFTEDGYIKLSYNGNTKIYSKEEFKLDKNKAYSYIDAYLNVTDLVNSDKTNSNLNLATIRISTDNKNNVKTYNLNLSKLVKEAENRIGGIVTEPTNSTVRSSSPLIIQSDNGLDTTVTYSSVSKSKNVKVENETLTDGNYIVLKIAVPDSMQKMIAKDDITTTLPNTAIQIADDYSYIMAILSVDDAKALENNQFSVTWGADGKTQITQNISIAFDENCYIEEIPENSVLPQSIAFNGLATTMYVGQTQNVSTTINKKYEGDKIRLSYSSSDPSIFTVNRVTGEINALKAGTAKITVEAIDANYKVITKVATIRVNNPIITSRITVSNIKDTSVTVNWAKNTTGQLVKVYAIPYCSTMGRTTTQWKQWIETKLKSNNENDIAIVETWKKAEVESSKTNVDITDLMAETKYIFYAAIQATNKGNISISSGSVSAVVTTRKTIFDSIKLKAVNKINGIETNLDDSQITVKNGFVVLNEEESQKFATTIRFSLYGKDTTELNSKTIFSSVSFKSSNSNVVRISKIVKNNTTGFVEATLILGGQAGIANITVSGKDSTGVLRTSNPVTFTVEKNASRLKAKTTTLTIGQSVALKDLISYDVVGSASQINVDNVDYEKTLTQLLQTGVFVLDDPENTNISKDTKVTVASLLKDSRGVKRSGLTTKVTFTLTYVESGVEKTNIAVATIRINQMSTPIIRSATTTDITATLQFTPNTTIKEVAGKEYYYTAMIKDLVTGKIVELKDDETDNNISASFTCIDNVYTCNISGLSFNKRYEVVLCAHYDAENTDLTNKILSKAINITTKKHLIASEGTININYVSLTDLTENPTKTGTPIVFENNEIVTLKNNETYIFMAQVSNLTRAIETDKISWTISSGDKAAATIKATSSTYEAQLKTLRTGTFTVTATSLVTKQKLATFTVKIVPYQSN